MHKYGNLRVLVSFGDQVPGCCGSQTLFFSLCKSIQSRHIVYESSQVYNWVRGEMLHIKKKGKKTKIHFVVKF